MNPPYSGLGGLYPSYSGLDGLNPSNPGLNCSEYAGYSCSTNGSPRSCCIGGRSSYAGYASFAYAEASSASISACIFLAISSFRALISYSISCCSFLANASLSTLLPMSKLPYSYSSLFILLASSKSNRSYSARACS